MEAGKMKSPRASVGLRIVAECARPSEQLRNISPATPVGIIIEASDYISLHDDADLALQLGAFVHRSSEPNVDFLTGNDALLRWMTELRNGGAKRLPNHLGHALFDYLAGTSGNRDRHQADNRYAAHDDPPFIWPLLIARIA
jgi:hypothetical protein